VPTDTRQRAPSHVPPREAVSFARKRPGSLYAGKSIGSFLPGLTRKAFEKYGFSAATLITDWPTIVGRELAAVTSPERLKWPRPVEHAEDDTQAPRKGRPGATLVLRVDGARALDFNRASMKFSEMTRDCQAQSQPSEFAGQRPIRLSESGRRSWSRGPSSS
jgi:hypothetical protein